MPARIGEWEGFKIIRERPPLQDGALGPRTAVLVVRHPGTHRGWVLPADEITDARTGAAGALAAAYLTLPGVSTGTIIGTGRVATALVHALDILASRPGGLQGLRDLRIYSRSPERRSAFIPSCGALQQLSLKESPSADAALQESRLVFVAAAATQPVVRMRQLTPGAHISYLAGSPTAGALDLDVITTARPLIFDQVDQARQSGEIKKVIRLGGWNQLHTCGGRLLGDAALGRVNRQIDEISVAYLTGLALLDLGYLTYSSTRTPWQRRRRRGVLPGA